ncbi:hypothetical protein J6590_085330 [Homalodisca vitripennis]|nr:hypothetical protein J6590_085330 [Homalodisca vitripennis]
MTSPELVLAVTKVVKRKKQISQSSPIQAEKDKIVSSMGRRYHVLQSSSPANNASSSTTSATDYYENVDQVLSAVSPASTYLSDYTDSTMDTFNFDF